MIGVYLIENKLNEKVYVGSSINVNSRIKEHIRTLKNNTHRNAHLQRAWNIYGESSFDFYCIECVLHEDILLTREQYWMDRLDSYISTKGYNICKVAGRTTGIRKSKAECQRISIMAKERAKKPDFHLRKFMFKKGHKPSAEALRKISEKASINFAGEKSYNAKLTNANVVQIIGRMQNGERDEDIANDYNVTRKTINHVRHRKTFRVVSDSICPGEGPIERSPKQNHRGENNPSSKLVARDVRLIKSLLQNGLSISEIARQFSVSWSTIKFIKEGRTWKHVLEEENNDAN